MTKMELIVTIAVVVLLAGAVAGFIWWRRRPKALNVDPFYDQWQSLQKMLRDKTKWCMAIVEADKLLEKALKKKHIAGHNMGERLVQAQRLFTDNDSVWFGHKLRNKIDADPSVKLKEADVKQALIGIRQALKDVGALPDGQSRSSK